MSIRTRLLIFLLSLSTLILIVGMVFYIQLKNLIEPLTPQSIPRSVEQLESSILKNNLVYHLLLQGQNIQTNLEDYVLTNNISNLQDAFMNQALFLQLLDKVKRSYPNLFNELDKKVNLLILEQNKILQLMQARKMAAAKQLLSSSHFESLELAVASVINRHYTNFDILTNESDVITVKLAANNTISVLRNSMQTTIIIFFIAITISLLLAIFGTNVVWRPLTLLRNNMEDISKRSLDIPIDDSLLQFKGEIGDLARTYGKLMTTLQTTTVSRDKLRDEIDRRIQTEENLRRTAKDLEESNYELDQFAYSASHDLRAPLRGIETICDWIREDCYSILPEKSRKHFDLLQKRANRLDSLIHSILEYSRAGKPNVQKEVTDLNKLIVDIFDTLIPPKHIHLIDDATLPKIVAYKALITQVFLNLFSNAIKFMDKPQGYIHVGYEESDDFYKFYVRDNGPGIDPQYHKKIFELFQMLQARDEIEGAGIGLSLVKKIVEKQGGSVDIESALGEGSTFYFTWPKNPV